MSNEIKFDWNCTHGERTTTWTVHGKLCRAVITSTLQDDSGFRAAFSTRSAPDRDELPIEKWILLDACHFTNLSEAQAWCRDKMLSVGEFRPTPTPSGEFFIVELMGHRVFGARVEPKTLGGVPMLSCVVVSPNKAEPGHEYIVNATQAIYAMTPCSEDEARVFNANRIMYLGHRIVDFRAPEGTGEPSRAPEEDEIRANASLHVTELWGAFEETPATSTLIEVGLSYTDVRARVVEKRGKHRCDDQESDGLLKIEPLRVAYARNLGDQDDGIVAQIKGMAAYFARASDIPF